LICSKRFNEQRYASNMTELHDLAATEQLASLRRREFSSIELTTHYLERIDRIDPTLGSFATVTAELALDEAARADKDRASGKDRPLLGLPLGIKDLFATGGVRTTYGSLAFADLVPTDDAHTVGLLRTAGSVLLGKTNAPEMGTTCYTQNRVAGITRNPWDLNRCPSGSSGGAAAATAAGLMPVGHASDGGGSTRLPASVCHLVGFKPSRGLVSYAPKSSYFLTAIEGPVARTVQDAALLLDVMAAGPASDMHMWRTEGTFADACQVEPRSLRIACWSDTGQAGREPSAEASAAFNRARGLLEELGHELVDLPHPRPHDEALMSLFNIWFGTALATAREGLPAAVRAELMPYSRHLADIGDTLTAVDCLAGQAAMAEYVGVFLQALDPFDAALTPTSATSAVPIGWFTEEGCDVEAERMLNWTCYTPWVNLTGLPAVSVPGYRDEHGLPLGVQLVGRRRGDLELLSLAAQMERAAPYAGEHPPAWFN
jgi:amidase